MRPAALLLPAILLLTVACSTSQPSIGPSVTPSANPVASGGPSPSSAPSTPAASPVVTPAPSAVPSPADTPAPSMTADEEALINHLRIDVPVNCVPRRADLPPGALFGIECRPDDPLVARVGIYAFKAGNDNAYAYMTRMASAGVDVNAGDCNRDIPGESAWLPGDGEGSIEDPGVWNWENSALIPERIGCFTDENGKANVRLTCGTDYIGVLGTGSDLSNLVDWTYRYPAGYEPGTPDSPGICVGDGLFAPDAP